MILPGTDEWHQARLGKATASRIYDVIGVKKDGKPYAARRQYMLELIAERLTGMSLGMSRFVSEAMMWGQQTEPQALAAYGRLRGGDTSSCGYVDHPAIPMSGATPDAHWWPGLVQVKCPETKTHIATLADRVIPDEYLAQMHWEMACVPTAEWCDYVSYDPRLPKELALAIIRIRRTPKIIAEMERRVREFLDELDNTMAALKAGELTAAKKPEASAAKRTEHLDSDAIARTL